MTPTSESERREVAARLREFADTDIWASKMISVWEKFGDTDRLSADILADLIDPTCEVVGDNTYTSDYDFRCKTCGEHFSAASTPRYCPGCGRRIDYGDR